MDFTREISEERVAFKAVLMPMPWGIPQWECEREIKHFLDVASHETVWILLHCDACDVFLLSIEFTSIQSLISPTFYIRFLLPGRTLSETVAHNKVST